MPKAMLSAKSVEGTFSLTGDLTLETVTDLWDQSQSLFNKSKSPIWLELESVMQSDSAGIALLIAWARQMRQQKKEFFLTHPPEQMQAIARVSGLTNLLPFILK